MKIRTTYNSRYFPKKYERNDEPSLTVPDQSLTVLELLQRHVQGLPIQAGKVPIYDGEEDPLGLEGVDYRQLDLTDRMDLLEAQREKVASMRKKTKKAPEEPENVVQDVKPEDIEDVPPVQH